MNQQLFEIILEEYKALRAEVLLCLERRVTIISFGLTAIALLTVAGVSLDNARAAALIFVLFVPATSAYVLAIWLAETHRARRASHYLWRIERRLEKEQQFKSLEWEGLLRQQGGMYSLFRIHYYWTVNWFTLVFFVSGWAGLHMLFDGICGWETTTGTYYISGIISFVASLILLLWGLARVKWLTETYNKTPEL